jgi:hypothetical protein
MRVVVNVFVKVKVCCLSALVLFSLARCKEPEPESPEMAPVIVVRGENPLLSGIYMTFVDDSVNIYSLHGLDSVWTEPDIDTSLLGYYRISYHAQSLSGMEAEAERDVWVVVKPESMKGLWDVALCVFPSDTLHTSFADSLCVENRKLIISNFNNVPELKIELSLAADLQDSVYIFEQYRFDSLYCVFGAGTIDQRATQMVLRHSVVGVEDGDTVRYTMTYSRQAPETPEKQ